jgi:hypothetical protein
MMGVRAMPLVHEEMHERTSKDQHKRQELRDVDPVLDEQQDSSSDPDDVYAGDEKSLRTFGHALHLARRSTMSLGPAISLLIQINR